MEQESKWPKLLNPSEKESIIIDGNNISIPKCIIQFKKWEGEPIKNDFGGKPIIEWKNSPMFAELAIFNICIECEWEARWVEVYGASKAPKILSSWGDDKYKNQIENPIEDETIKKLLFGIHELNNKSFSGCWDVITWKEERIIFAEAKHQKKDKIRNTQMEWLAAGLKYGLNPDNFLIVEWELNS